MGFDRAVAKYLQGVFMPYSAQRTDFVRRNNIRFAYYTSAHVALSILDHQEVWLRNSRIMNDFREVLHGQKCLDSAWNASEGHRFVEVLESVSEGLGKRLETALNELRFSRNEATYLLSVSEHDDTEDSYGRLSMWRAYGGNVNVCLVLKNNPFIGDSDALNAFTSPVMYAEEREFQSAFKDIVDHATREVDTLRGVDPDLIFQAAFVAMHFAILATKHPGFREEREWRILHSPNVWPSDTLVKQHVIVEGIPQKIFKIPLKNVPERGLLGAEIPELIDRIIIGPNQYPLQIAEVLAEKLAERGVEKPMEKIAISTIPLRR